MTDLRKIKFDGQVDVTMEIDGEKKVVGVAKMEPVQGSDHIAHVTIFDEFVSAFAEDFSSFSIDEFEPPAE